MNATTDNRDHQLQQQVTLTLERGQLTRGCRLRVMSRSGVVELAGEVPTYYRRQLLFASVRRVAGVVGVIDELKVRPQSSPRYRGDAE